MKILRQKQFGVIGKLASRGIDNIYKNMLRRQDKISMYRDRYKGGSLTGTNMKLNNDLLEKSNKLGMISGSVLGNDPSSIAKNSLSIEELSGKSNTNPLKMSVSKGHTGYINVNSKDHTPGEIAHEMGHLIYSRTPKGIKNTKNAYLQEGRKYELANGKQFNKRSDAIKSSFRELTDLSGLRTEAAASRIGIKLLKKSGASKKQIKQARRELRPAFRNYVASHLAYTLSPISKYGNRNKNK